jgi:multidrug efflux pump subunit AcrB
MQESMQSGPANGGTVDFKLYSEDTQALSNAAKQVEKLLLADNRLKNVTNNLAKQTPKWNLTVNETGKKLGIDVQQVQAVVHSYLHGQSLNDVEIGKVTQTLTIMYDDTIDSIDELKKIVVPTAAGGKQLGDIVTITETTAPISIQHDQGRQYAQVSATVKSADTSQVSKAVSDDVHALSLPKGVTLETTGGFVDIIEGFQDLGIAMVVAIGLVFLLMSVTFGGVVTPFIILSTLLFVPIGAIAGLLITGQTLSMSGMIGLLMLIGIVVTNAIVLLDRIETNRRDGMELNEAIIEASKTRLRPILMTALATIFALLPLALSADSTQLVSKGLAVTVIGGLTTSTLLTLIFVPVVNATVRKKDKVREGVEQ